MRQNKLRQQLRQGEASIGTFMGLGSPAVAELLGHAGFDWLVIETEHNALDTTQVQHMLMAIQSTEAVPLVRVPDDSNTMIQRALDIGAMGVVVPLVRTVEQAERIVRATRYPPDGTRSFGGLRASRYTFDDEGYFSQANDNIVVTLILETLEAVENLERIASVPGIDALFIGTMDLSLSLGLDPFRQPHPELDDIYRQALAVGQKTGVAIGMGAATPDDVEHLRENGVTMIGFSSDYRMLRSASAPGLQAFADQRSQQVAALGPLA